MSGTWVHRDFAVKSTRDLVADVKTDTMGLGVHTSWGRIMGLKIRFKQILLVFLTDAYAVIWHRNQNFLSCRVHSKSADFDSDRRIPMWKFEGVRKPIDQYLLNSDFIDLKKVLDFIIWRFNLNCYIFKCGLPFENFCGIWNDSVDILWFKV